MIRASGIPPSHSILLHVTMTTLCLTFLPSPTSLDAVATIDAFTTPAYDFISIRTIAFWRLLFAAIGIGTTIQMIFCHTATVNFTPKKNSLINAAPFTLVGIRTQSFFTTWAWNLLTLSFLLSGTIPLLVALGHEDLITPALLRTALVTFEMAAPTEFLVASVVTYAIWPGMLKNRKGKDKSKDLRTFSSLMMHNTCIGFILAEMAFIGRIPFLLTHMSLAPLLGLVYILFAWYAANKWVPEKGPQYLYFFLDTTLGWETTIAMGVLLTVLLSFYVLIWIFVTAFSFIPYALLRVGLSGLLGYFVCRVRD